MTPELWLAVGTIVAAILGLGGIIYSTRAKPEPLSTVVKSQAEQIKQLQERVTELETRLGTVTRLERNLSRALAGASLLITQARAAGLAPIWEIPADMAGPVGD